MKLSKGMVIESQGRIFEIAQIDPLTNGHILVRKLNPPGAFDSASLDSISVRIDRVLTKSLVQHLFGKNVRTLRREQGLNQSELGERLGCTPSYVNRIETGCVGFSTPSILKLCVALSCRPSDLFSNI